MPSNRLSLATLLLVTAMGTALASGPALLSHRAVYDIGLVAEKSKGLVAASGRIAFEFTGNECDGYALNFRQVTNLDDGEGRQKQLDMRSTTWEDGKGKHFQFNSRNLINSQTSQLADGKADRGEDGGVSISLKQPRPLKVDLPGEAIFPTEHTRRLLDAARAGQRTLIVPLFDGSDGGQKIYDTTSLIGKMIEGESAARLEPAARDAGFDTMRRWPVSISYFDSGASGDRVPIYVMSFDLLDNGVYSNLRFDFGDFSLNARMSQFQTLKVEECRKK